MQQRRPEMGQEVAQLHAELRKVRDERDRAHRVLEVTEWKALASANDRTTIETLEAELDASRESEKRMLDSLALQTKQLELTKISLEEAKLEVATLQETVQRMESKSISRAPVVATPRSRHDRDLQRVHGELRMALAAEEKSRKAMEEFVMALKEVNAELHATRQQLALAQHEAEAARMEADRVHVSPRRRDDSLRAVSDEPGPAPRRGRGVVRGVAGQGGRVHGAHQGLGGRARRRPPRERAAPRVAAVRARRGVKAAGHPEAGRQGHQGREGGAGGGQGRERDA
jgi:hypothetical protein